MGLITRFYGPNAKGSKLTIKEMDNNLYYLQNNGVVGVDFLSGNLILTNPTGATLTTKIDRYNKNYIPSGETFTVPNGYQNFVYGDVIIEGTLNIEENGELVVLNGDIIISGGTIVGSGTTYSVTLPEFNTFVTSGNYNSTSKQITFNGNFGFNPFSVNLSGLSTDNFYTTGATLNGGIIEFSRNDTANAYSVDLNSLKFTGNTSGNCITDLYVTNVYGCSPLNIQTDLNVNGSVSATTYYGDGSNLSGISTQDIYVTGGTFSNGTASFTNNIGGTFNVTGITTTPSVNYIIYKALVSLSGGIFTVTQLENTIGDGSGVSPNDIQWSNPNNGIIRATKTGAFTSSNILISVENINGGGVPYICTGQKSTSNFISINIFLHDGTLLSTPNFTNLPVEIRIYN